MIVSIIIVRTDRNISSNSSNIDSSINNTCFGANLIFSWSGPTAYVGRPGPDTFFWASKPQGQIQLLERSAACRLACWDPTRSCSGCLPGPKPLLQAVSDKSLKWQPLTPEPLSRSSYEVLFMVVSENLSPKCAASKQTNSLDLRAKSPKSFTGVWDSKRAKFIFYMVGGLGFVGRRA